MDELSDQVRLILQGGIQRVLHSFKDASSSEKDDLNTLMAFYRAMHSMALNAMKIERKLNDSTRQTDRLFREFGSGNRLQETSAAEVTNVRFSGRDVNGDGPDRTEGSSSETRESGNSRIILDFQRPEGTDVVPESE